MIAPSSHGQCQGQATADGASNDDADAIVRGGYGVFILQDSNGSGSEMGSGQRVGNPMRHDAIPPTTCTTHLLMVIHDTLGTSEDRNVRLHSTCSMTQVREQTRCALKIFFPVEITYKRDMR
jgi:hypothetical protein